MLLKSCYEWKGQKMVQRQKIGDHEPLRKRKYGGTRKSPKSQREMKKKEEARSVGEFLLPVCFAKKATDFKGSLFKS